MKNVPKNLIFNFYALTDNEKDGSVASIPVSADVQIALGAEFEQQLGIFSMHGRVEVVGYEPAYHPDSHEMLALEKFQLPETLHNAFLGTREVRSLSIEDLENDRITAIVAVGRSTSGQDIFALFQVFDRRQLLLPSRIGLLFKGSQVSRLEDAGLQIGTGLTAIHADGQLYFRSEHQVRRFLDLDAVFRAATDADVVEFGSNSLFAGTAGMLLPLVDTILRRKITSILARGLLDGASVTDLSAVAVRYGIALEVIDSNGEPRIQLPATKKLLVPLLRFLSQDYLHCELTGDRFVTSSKRPIKL